MGKYIHKFSTVSDYEALWNSSQYLEPWVSYTTENDNINYNKTASEKALISYMTFEILTDGYFNWKASSNTGARTIKYSINDGAWTTITSTTSGITVNVSTGDVVRFKGSNASYVSSAGSAYSYFTSSCRFNLSGNFMSMIYEDDFIDKDVFKTVSSTYYVSKSFFSSCLVVNAENFILPATNLSDSCYAYMFKNCTSLITPPKILASTIENRSCMSMFEGCTNLLSAPDLLATTIVDMGYYKMFKDCTSLNYIECLATDISASDCTANWVDGVSSTGTFIKSSSMSDWTTGVNGIPENWTVQNS